MNHHLFAFLLLAAAHHVGQAAGQAEQDESDEQAIAVLAGLRDFLVFDGSRSG